MRLTTTVRSTVPRCPRKVLTFSNMSGSWLFPPQRIFISWNLRPNLVEGWVFPENHSRQKNTHLIHCEPIIFWRLKKKTETTETTHQQLFAESLLHISNQSEFVHEERTATAGHGLDRHFDGVAHAGHLFHSGGVRHSGPSNGKATFTSSGCWANPLRITYQSASQHI